MTDTNHVVLIGRLTRDLGADERSFAYTANGTARANVSIAVNRSATRRSWKGDGSTGRLSKPWKTTTARRATR